MLWKSLKERTFGKIVNPVPAVLSKNKLHCKDFSITLLQEITAAEN